MPEEYARADTVRIPMGFHIIDNCFRSINLAIRYGLPCWAGVEIFKVAAGKETIIRVFSNAFDAYGPSPLGFSVSAILLVWAVAERRLRHRKVRYLQGRVIQLERQIDPNRTTSGLTPEGTTNPRDRT